MTNASSRAPSGLDLTEAFGDAFTPFVGEGCEAAVWAAALTDEEIAALASGINLRLIRSASLWGYWPVLGLDSPEPDWSGNGRNMTLVGSPAYATHAPTQLWIPPRTGPGPVVAAAGALKVGAADIAGAYVGSAALARIYSGSNLIKQF